MPRGHVHTKETLFKKVKKSRNGCWNFTGAICKRTGYGKIGRYGSVINAHRLSWILVNGEIGDSSLMVCHKCDNRSCINPDHLFIGTAKDNTHDMMSKGRGRFGLKLRVGSTCMHGHLIKPGGLFRYTTKHGNEITICKKCKHENYLRNKNKRNNHH